ncbi:hypothetical protein BDY19DRAFT_187678 [Irpex rosettiformis]|uniref:Uncharacterized protein n=1 Tax=Irpex rosettiformis TaxID=378272 RepID=A0ACB8U1X6_9APHY|nr:hypothetical protein BDY19DRAFT_187678 [Irpex rosettiformis]
MTYPDKFRHKLVHLTSVSILLTILQRLNLAAKCPVWSLLPWQCSELDAMRLVLRPPTPPLRFLTTLNHQLLRVCRCRCACSYLQCLKVYTVSVMGMLAYRKKYSTDRKGMLLYLSAAAYNVTRHSDLVLHEALDNIVLGHCTRNCALFISCELSGKSNQASVLSQDEVSRSWRRAKTFWPVMTKPLSTLNFQRAYPTLLPRVADLLRNLLYKLLYLVGL